MTKPRMTRVIVLEGADASGKTALAEELLLDYPEDMTVYIHNDASDAKLPGSLYRHYKAQLLDALDRRETITVIDRSFLSEWVYGTTYRGKARISRRQARKLSKWALKNGVEFIGMQAGTDVRYTRMRERGENFDLFYELQVQRRFRDFFRDAGWTTVRS
jgi:thymidylate kinase